MSHRPPASSVASLAAPRPQPRTGYQHHHILPLALGRHAQIARFLDDLAAQGFRLTDRQTNCLWLPAKEALAWSSGAALHRGPHPHYTDVVASRIDRIRQRRLTQINSEGDAVTLHRLRRLQRALAHVLAGTGPRLVQLNRRDPLHLFSDYSQLDAAISALDLTALDLTPFSGGG